MLSSKVTIQNSESIVIGLCKLDLLTGKVEATATSYRGNGWPKGGIIADDVGVVHCIHCRTGFARSLQHG